jgi:hypothetical protein
MTHVEPGAWALPSSPDAPEAAAPDDAGADADELPPDYGPGPPGPPPFGASRRPLAQ